MKEVLGYLRSNSWIPSAIIIGPEAQLTQTGYGEQHVLLNMGCAVKWVNKFFRMTVDKGPKRNSLLFNIFFQTLLLTIKRVYIKMLV